jgi:hypothetical protein
LGFLLKARLIRQIPLSGIRSVMTMSKPIARVTIAILISLVLVAATYMTVQGAIPRGDSQGVHVVNGLQTNFNHYRSTIQELQSVQLQNQPGNSPHQSGGCHSDFPASSDG